MNIQGRNEPCHCGSGKKYKKCCLHRDEDERRRQQEVKGAFIDPFAGDDDWVDEPILEREENPDDEDDRMSEDYPEETGDSPCGMTAEENMGTRPAKKELSDAEEEIIDDWWAAYRNMSDPDTLRGHLENFMSTHPDLVIELGLDREPLFELGSMYVRQDRHKDYIDTLSRLRLEFPDAYFKGFAYFDNAMPSGRKIRTPLPLRSFMQVRTKKLHTKKNLVSLCFLVHPANVERIKRYVSSIEPAEGEEGTISSEEFFNKHFTGLPEWAVLLRGYRTRENLTQAALAEATGIPQRHISEMENGKRPIGKERAKILAAALNTDHRVFL